MHYQCLACEMIHETREGALGCCPPRISVVPDEEVLYCRHCKGWCCSRCGQKGILLKHEVERDALLRYRFEQEMHETEAMS
jgi:hypothetical protein